MECLFARLRGAGCQEDLQIREAEGVLSVNQWLDRDFLARDARWVHDGEETVGV
jgi:hypothetical protein